MTNHNILHINHIDSTNNYFKSNKHKTRLEEGTAIMADYQENGRGQVGNVWQSDDGRNILMSVYLKPRFIPIEHIFALNMMVSLAVISFLSKHHIEASIKWPNDILVNSKKIGGILIENTLQGTGINDSVIGIGLNTNQIEFRTFNTTATSLKLENETMEWDVKKLTGLLLEEILSGYHHQKRNFNFDMLTTAYHAKLHGMHKWLPFEDNESAYEGSIQGVDSYGFLKIKRREGELKSYAFKEVRFLEG